MDDKQHGFDPHPKDRPDKYSPITQAFPITITSTEAITGLQFEAVDEDCVRPWLSGMAGELLPFVLCGKMMLLQKHLLPCSVAQHFLRY